MTLFIPAMLFVFSNTIGSKFVILSVLPFTSLPSKSVYPFKTSITPTL